MSSGRYYLSAQIDTSAIVHNCGVLRGLVPAGCRLCAVVKCNAYGHGAEVVLPALKSEGVEMLCVATIDEAQQLKRFGWQRPVLLSGSEFSIYSGKQKDELARWIVDNQIRITLMNKGDVEALCAAARSVQKPAIVHLKLDSGMSRMGLGEQGLGELINEIKGIDEITIEGLYTHLATADQADKSYAHYQLQRFRKFVEKLQVSGLQIPVIHAANSAAAIDIADSYFDMIRPGISIYGCYPSPYVHGRVDLKPAMKLVSFLTLVKDIPAGSYIGYGCTYKASDDMTIGVVPIGYGDGYSRRLSNIGKMIIAGHLVPVVGRVSMDLTTVDLSGLVGKGIKLSAGQEVTVIDNVRDSPNSIESIAAKLETIPYDIVTNLGQRIIRVPVR